MKCLLESSTCYALESEITLLQGAGIRSLIAHWAVGAVSFAPTCVVKD